MYMFSNAGLISELKKKMNIYSRPGELDQPPPDMGRTETEEDDNFLNDADLAIDRLPQPYRTIDKIIINIFNKTWEEIQTREEEHQERIKHQQMNCVHANNVVESLTECSSICFSPDSKYGFASMFSGELIIFSVEDNKTICVLQTDEVDASCLDSIKCVSIRPGAYLLACIDDMGFAKLYIYSDLSLYFVQNLNEQLEGSEKSNAEQFDFNLDGDFAGLALRMNDKCWLNFYRLPKDTWMNEIENALKKRLEEKEVKRTPSGKNSKNLAVEKNDSSNTKVKVDFTQSQFMYKISQPSKVEGNSYSSYKDALERASTNFGIGTGDSHLFTETHLRIRRAAIKKIYSEQMSHFNPHQFSIEYSPSWHFLKSAKLQPKSSPSQEGSVSVLVWWTNSYDAHIYALTQQPRLSSYSAKETPITAEIVWPMCDLIESSAVSPSTLQIAFGMSNGTVSVIDRNECFPLSAMMVRPGTAVRKINFIESEFDTKLLVSMADGGVSFISCKQQVCRDITPRLGRGDFELMLLSSLPSLHTKQYFICASSLDRLQLYDVDKSFSVCDIVFSESLEEPNERFFCSPDGRKIYAKNDDGTICDVRLDKLDVIESLFETSSRESPSKGYSSSASSSSSFEEQMQGLLTRRTEMQLQRTIKFRDRWFEMARELQTAK